MSGAQLFDESDIQVVSINPEGTQRNGFEITGLKPGQYTISTKQKTIGTIYYLYANVKNGSGEYGKAQYIVTSVSIDNVAISISSGDTLIIYDASASNSTEVSKDIFSEYGIMLNIGSVALPYEPHKPPQTVTLTADRPLTKWDKLEKRNGQWGWVYKSKRFTSNDMIGFSDIWMPSMVWRIKNKEDYVVQNKDFYCEYFKVVRASNAAGSGFSINMNDYPEIQTAVDMANFVNSKEGSELPVTVCAETIQETFVPLSASEQESMNALYTFRPTTVLSNDEGCEMSLTYKTKKSLEVTT